MRRGSPTWTLDPGLTVVAFSARRMGMPWANGRFPNVRGKLHLDWEEPLQTTCVGEIDATGLVAGDPRLNTELRTADLLDLRRHPTIGFSARLVDRDGEEHFTAAVELTVKGVTRPLSMAVRYLGQWQEQSRLRDGERRMLTRVAMHAHAEVTRAELVGPEHDRPGGVGPTDGAPIEISLDLNAVLDADLPAAGAIGELERSV